jgi:hypothetical protein
MLFIFIMVCHAVLVSVFFSLNTSEHLILALIGAVMFFVGRVTK